MGKKVESSLYSQVAIPLLAEFTTQFIHTFWGVMSSGPYIPPSNTSTSHSVESDASRYLQGVFVPALQSGFSVWMQIVLFWKISCVHFNPAVSMGLLVAGQLKVMMFVPYVLTQCISSIVAAYVAKIFVNLFYELPNVKLLFTQIALGAPPSIIVVPDETSGVAVFFNEVIMTGCLIFFAVAMVADKTYDQATGPLAIGLTVFQGILSARWVGVSCISPSRAFGPAVVTGGPAWNRHWLLWVSDMTGAILFSGFYMLFFAPKPKRWLLRMKKKTKDLPDDRSFTTNDTKEALINETNI